MEGKSRMNVYCLRIFWSPSEWRTVYDQSITSPSEIAEILESVKSWLANWMASFTSEISWHATSSKTRSSKPIQIYTLKFSIGISIYERYFLISECLPSVAFHSSALSFSIQRSPLNLLSKNRAIFKRMYRISVF